jgi:hypothetical protein
MVFESFEPICTESYHLMRPFIKVEIRIVVCLTHPHPELGQEQKKIQFCTVVRDTTHSYAQVYSWECTSFSPDWWTVYQTGSIPVRLYWYNPIFS